MAVSFITTDQVATQSLASVDRLYLAEGASIIPAAGTAITLNAAAVFDVDLYIAGAVASSNIAISMFGDSNGDTTGTGYYDITIAETGTVVSLENNGMKTVGSGNIVNNFGLIATLSSQYAGYRNVGDNLSLRNFGEIVGGVGVRLTGIADYRVATVENLGVIQGEIYGISAVTGLNLNNSGSIIASEDSGTSQAIFLNNTGVSLVGSVINNSGLISSSGNAINISDAYDNVVTNSGEIIGNILFSGGNDTFDGRGGTVNGTVAGRDGDDTYITDSSTLNLSERAAEGTDLVMSTVSWTLGDNFENLTLIGANGTRGIGNALDNVIIGNDADNRLRGRAGDDDINGAGGEDNIRGQKGNDTLDGGFGDDIINGNRGNDTLSGGAGNDLLKGGYGSDRYNFDFENDGNDTISDVGGSSDTLVIAGRVMSQLDFSRLGDKLIIESGGTVDHIVINNFYKDGDVGRVELLETTTSTKYLQTGLIGDVTDDIIVGSSGTQIIRGEAGDDILIGKGDKDRMYGGSGADRFDYDALSDSGTTSTTMDTIYDFVAGTDTIDLFDVDADSTVAGNQNFSFIGAAAYSGTAGELRYEFVGGNTQLGVDVDGDMVSDFNILLAGNIAFSAGDFVL